MSTAARGVSGLASLLALSLMISGCDKAPASQLSRQAEEGSRLVSSLGCGGCHVIPGIKNATGLVGPALDGLATRIYIAGVLRNNPDNLARWVKHPQRYLPGGVMPDIPMSDDSAVKIAAFLSTLR